MLNYKKLKCIRDPRQGEFKKVLVVCHSGCLRSPTAAHILACRPWFYNTRSAGTSKHHSITKLTKTLVLWADVILVVDDRKALKVKKLQAKLVEDFKNDAFFDYKPQDIINLNIANTYNYRSPELVAILTQKFENLFPT